MYYPPNNQVMDRVRIMTVVGNGELSVQPDTVRIQLEILTRDESLQKAQSENAKRTTQVIQALLHMGLSQENIQTAAYNINPLYDYDDGKQIFKGYEVGHTLSVEHKGIEEAGQIIDVTVQQGVNRVGQIEFVVENHQKYEREVLQLAVYDAQRKAELIGSSLNVSIDLVPLRVTELFASDVHSSQPFLKMESNTTPIEPGNILIQTSLETEFQY